MDTNLTRKQVEAGEFNIEDIYSNIRLAAQVLRGIYVMYGWNHMTETLHQTDETIESLMKSAVDGLKKSSDTSYASTAGMRVQASYDRMSSNPEEDILEINVFFEVM